MQAFAASGLTMAAFARREGINYATFAGWVLKAQKSVGVKRPIKFAEVRLPWSSSVNDSADERLEVRLPDGTVLRGRRVTDVVTLVRALRS